MLQAWMSYGYIVLLAIGVLAYVLWRRGGEFWPSRRSWWASPSGSDCKCASHMDDRRRDRNGSAPQRSRPRGNTSDIQYIYMRNRSDRGLELINEDSWWWLKRNSDRVFNDAKTAEAPNTEVTLLWNGWRSTLLSFYPNVIAIGPRRLLAAVVGADRHVLRPLCSPLARLLLRLHQAASVECLGECSQPRSRVIEPPLQAASDNTISIGDVGFGHLRRLSARCIASADHSAADVFGHIGDRREGPLSDVANGSDSIAGRTTSKEGSGRGANLWYFSC